ncbi:MAG: carbon-nitrogen hydrolase family protein [Pseudomonadota bacterium]
MRLMILQMTASDDPQDNLSVVLDAMDQTQGVADILMTPEVTNCVSLSRAHQNQVLDLWDGNGFLAAVQARAVALGIWVLLGSVAVKTNDPDGRFANRSVLVSPMGRIAAWYDKIHMFDVTLPNGETYTESNGYRPGDCAVLARTPWAMLGLSVCYDVRFPYLYRDLAQSGAQVLTVPSAFAVATGQAHWETLLRARAIETGCFVVAPAQTGTHPGSGRKTYGHSLVIDPWGQVVLDMGTASGLQSCTLDLGQVDTARAAVPSVMATQTYKMDV